LAIIYNIMKKIIYFYSIIFLILIFSCNKDSFVDPFQNYGKIIEIEKNLEQFDSLIIKSYFVVNLVQDTINKIKIKGGENIISDVSINLNNGNLTLTNLNKGLFTHPQKYVEIELHFKNLSLIMAQNACSINSVNEIVSQEIGLIFSTKIAEANIKLNSTTFYFWNSRGGKLTLSGNVNSLKIWNFNLNVVDASQLKADYVLFENHSITDCYVNVLETFDCKIFSTGNVYYKGNPQTINYEENENKGKLFKME